MLRFYAAFLAGLFIAVSASAASTWNSFSSWTNIPFNNSSGVTIDSLPGTDLYISCKNLSFSTAGSDVLLKLGQPAGLITSNYQWWMRWSVYGKPALNFASSGDNGEGGFVRVSPKGDSTATTSQGDVWSFELNMPGFGNAGYKYFRASGSYQSKAATGAQGEFVTVFHNWFNPNPLTSVYIFPETGTFSGECDAEVH